MRLDVCGVDHLGFGRATPTRQFLEHPLPHTAFRPAHEAIVDRRWRAVFGGTVAPAASALQYMQDATNHAPIIHPGLATHVGRQQRFDLRPLFVGQPKQIAAHGPLPHGRRPENRGKTDSATRLLGFHPSHHGAISVSTRCRFGRELIAAKAGHRPPVACRKLTSCNYQPSQITTKKPIRKPTTIMGRRGNGMGVRMGADCPPGQMISLASTTAETGSASAWRAIQARAHWSAPRARFSSH